MVIVRRQLQHQDGQRQQRKQGAAHSMWRPRLRFLMPFCHPSDMLPQPMSSLYLHDKAAPSL